MTVEGLGRNGRVVSEVTIAAFYLIGLNEANANLRLAALTLTEFNLVRPDCTGRVTHSRAIL